MDNIFIEKIFLKYILFPLILIILTVILGILKKQLPNVKTKTLILYIVVTSFCIGLFGLLGFSGNMFNPYWYLVAMVIFFIFGILHVNLVNKYFNDSTKPKWFSILFESLITLTCVIFGGYIFYLIYDFVSPFKGYAIMAATSITIFTVPLAFYYCFVQYINIPFDIYNTWAPSRNYVMVNFDEIKIKKILLLRIELTKAVVEGKKTRIDAKSPSDGVSVADWFYRVVDDYNHKYPNETIHLFDTHKKYYSWIFYTKKSFFHFRKMIDFDKNMEENKITQNTTIICKRVVSSKIKD